MLKMSSATSRLHKFLVPRGLPTFSHGKVHSLDQYTLVALTVCNHNHCVYLAAPINFNEAVLMTADKSTPIIRRLSIQRFRSIRSMTWWPAAGVNFILGGGDVGKTTILDAIALLLSPTNPSVVPDTDYFGRAEDHGFVIDAVVSLPTDSKIHDLLKVSWPWDWNGTDPLVPNIERDDVTAKNDPVYWLQVTGTPELELVYGIKQPDGTTAYTRAGSFQMSNTGEIVTADGLTVNPGLTIPADTVTVSVNASGQVLAQISGQTQTQTVGQLELATFPNEAGLLNVGSNLLVETAASGSPVQGAPASVGFGSLQQGFLETSNVNVVNEITNLITAQRAYEMNSKVIQVSDQMSSSLNSFR